ncbi:RdgB/HAM1 family non-canonical purine NTP pyrophosphatase [bacterium]|nr:RdgB/HAM1 family non-canonical purine NTP pyrophosphatase [bacterium]
MKIVLASSNEHKVQEINEIAADYGIDVKFILPPNNFNPIENGKTFQENSYIKAREAWKLAKSWILADDSGLCIDALNGAPGIYSARYADTPELRIKRVLNELNGTADRKAYFACAMTLINPQGKVEYSFEGRCEGTIIREPRGKNGFGYDPIFLPRNYTKTIAELSEDEKNQISHRSVALRQILNYIKTNLLITEIH